MIVMILGVLFGVFVFNYVMIGITAICILLTPHFVLVFEIFGKHGERKVQEQALVWTKRRFSIIPYLVAGYDLEASDVKDERNYKIIYILLMTLLGFIPGIALLVLLWGLESAHADFLKGVGVAILSHYFIQILALIRISGANQSSFRALLRSKALELRKGASYEQIVLPTELLTFRTNDYYTRIKYLEICCRKYLWLQDYNQLNAYIRDMDLTLKHGKKNGGFIYSPLYVDGYYQILYYSTFVNPNFVNATRVYNVIKTYLEQDMNANGRRVLAYYQYYVMKRPDLAAITLSQAVEGMKQAKFLKMCDADIALSNRLIDQLQDIMTNQLNPAERKPVIPIDEDAMM